MRCPASFKRPAREQTAETMWGLTLMYGSGMTNYLRCAVFGHDYAALPSQFGTYGLHRCEACGDMKYPAIDVMAADVTPYNGVPEQRRVVRRPASDTRRSLA